MYKNKYIGMVGSFVGLAEEYTVEFSGPGYIDENVPIVSLLSDLQTHGQRGKDSDGCCSLGFSTFKWRGNDK